MCLSLPVPPSLSESPKRRQPPGHNTAQHKGMLDNCGLSKQSQSGNKS